MIVVKNLNKWYGEKHVLKNLNLKVEMGEIFGLLGPNGAGKTTLLNILTGQVRGDGYVRVLGVNPMESPVEVRKLVGIVPESESLPNYLTAREYLEFVADIRGVGRDRVNESIERFKLNGYEDVLCKNLSKGTKQRLMIAAAMIHKPELLFMDEPFINLDPINQREMQAVVRDYVSKGGTVFMTTHILEIAEKICSRVGIIKDGKIVRILEDVENLEEEFMREFDASQVLPH